MKNYLFLLFLLIGFCGCVKADHDVESWIKKMEKGSQDDGIIYPCATSDLNCIRKFFSMHGHCKPKHGPVPDPLMIDRHMVRLPASNLTFVLLDSKVTGLDGKITAFYINTKTDNLVIALQAKPLTIMSPLTIFRYNRKNKEPIVLGDSLFVQFNDVTMTAVIPNIRNLQLDKIEVFPYLEDSNIPYALGPGVMKSYNPVVLASFNALVRRVANNSKEGMTMQSPMFMKAYIQSNICDFGVN